MVKHMPASLSRIEREFVVRNLEEQKPSLSVLAKNRLYTIPENFWSFEDGLILCSGFFDRTLQGSPVSIFFRHNKRGMFFLTDLQFLEPDRFFFEIPAELFKQDLGTERSRAGKLLFNFSRNVYEANSTELYPLDTVLVDPAVCLQRRNSILKLSGKIGIDDSDSLAGFGLFEYLDGIRTSGLSDFPEGTAGDFFFVDHQYALASIFISDAELPVSGTRLDITLHYENRKIFVESSLAGAITVRNALHLLCLNIDSAQEEDKRYLFEKLYKSKY